jgi:outer membrane protein OmpA-like peptidoglycan-associated protein
MRLRLALLSATVLALPVAAMAQPITGLYVGGGVGPNYQQDEHVRASSGLGTDSSTIKFKDVGGTGVASVGYGLGNGLRIELEGNYRYNEVNGFTSGGIGGKSSNGFQEKYGAMVNALYDFDVGIPGFYPYVGAGAGYAWNNWHSVGGDAEDGSYNIRSTDTYGSVAYQGIVGVAYPVAPVPGLSATLEYRFLGKQGYQRETGQNVTVGNEAHGNLDFTNDYNHSILIGLRYAFGVTPPPPPAPAPAPAAVPAPAPARTYLVFFDWDKSDLTARARQIISDAASASTHVQTTRIEVNGYTDLSGTAKYNMGLSIRRANAVAAELVRDGVSRSEISIQGFGETHPLVPTAQGVREPQNRRVEIILK